VFENRVLRRIFGPKRDEATGDWRRLHNEERNDLYSSPSIIRVIKSRRLRWAGHVARMGRREVHAGFWWGDPGQVAGCCECGNEPSVSIKCREFLD
jgi:hypothetical protein